MSTIKSRMDKVIQELVNEEDALKIGDANLEFEGVSCLATHSLSILITITISLVILAH